MTKKNISPKNSNTAKITINNKTYTLPIYKASEGSNVIDITKLYAESNHFTYDPGFTSTASCQSNITFIDGNKGILRYRGYDIEVLAKNSDFIEVTNNLAAGAEIVLEGAIALLSLCGVRTRSRTRTGDMGNPWLVKEPIARRATNYYRAAVGITLSGLRC